TEEEYRRAVDASPTWKPLNRAGRYFLATGKTDEAIKLLERSRAADPHNLQNLLTLAEAHRTAHNTDAALSVYRSLVALENTPVGTLRALPERIPWEFAVSHFALGEEALMRTDRKTAEEELSAGMRTADEFWRLRADARNQVSDDVWRRVT